MGLFCYNQQTGEGQFYTLDRQGNILPLQLYSSLPEHWTHVVPGLFGGSDHTDLFFYDANTGKGRFCTTSSQGSIQPLADTQVGVGWTHVIPGFFGGSDYTGLLFYSGKKDEEQGQFYSWDGQSRLHQFPVHSRWLSLTHIVPGLFAGDDYTDLFFYNANTGLAFFATTDEGNLTIVNSFSDGQHKWASIVPGFFGGENDYTGLLFYEGGGEEGEGDPEHGHGRFCRTDGQGDLHELQNFPWIGDLMIVPLHFRGDRYTGVFTYSPHYWGAAVYTTSGLGQLKRIANYPIWPPHEPGSKRKQWTHVIEWGPLFFET